MAAIRGNNGVLTIGSGKVASLTSYTLDTTQDTAETSAMSSTGRTYVKTMHGYSGSADFIFEGPDSAAQQTTITELEFATDAAETATMTLFPDSFDGVVTGSLTFQGTGTLAYTAAS